MPDLRRQTCLTCGKHAAEVGPISWRGNCRPCGELVQRENIAGIAAKSGYAFKRQVRGMKRYADSILQDDRKAV